MEGLYYSWGENRHGMLSRLWQWLTAGYAARKIFPKLKEVPQSAPFICRDKDPAHSEENKMWRTKLHTTYLVKELTWDTGAMLVKDLGEDTDTNRKYATAGSKPEYLAKEEARKEFKRREDERDRNMLQDNAKINNTKEEVVQ